ncbi:MAG: glutathione S-transferase [Gammaproteobacteria bacterium]|uniref:Glutathione S-transferase n=1 Tax=OM182 bacterium MED-G24 TaxID=1986255 RepID=A0A2A5WQW2_9GAMM|nr:glutathione S-transferase [Gammaproteobacteria bacterium]PDH38925.1 MAG: glutathione S-transferase [OM182 bacterium MED-G24]RPG24782.1 MAG: glutathione S-transferase family protein [Gammaproteobacteria bacterium TMED50]|tara:strand:+ start:1926 stop:2543 length:618 start_codon:yes stop_codon:yes gene_type:complete
MLKLHGIQMSNYYTIAKMILLEKGIDFEEVNQMPGRDEAWLARSPMGKVPALETPEGSIAETMAIAEYLEELQPEPRLLPGEAFARAKARQIAHHAIYYVDLAARPGLNAAAFGAPEDESINKTIAKLAPRGIRALGAIASFDPWIGGDTFTLADIVAANTIPLATMVAKKLCNIDLTAELPGAAEWMARINDRDSMKQINADRA